MCFYRKVRGKGGPICTEEISSTFTSSMLDSCDWQVNAAVVEKADGISFYICGRR